MECDEVFTNDVPLGIGVASILQKLAIVRITVGQQFLSQITELNFRDRVTSLPTPPLPEGGAGRSEQPSHLTLRRGGRETGPCRGPWGSLAWTTRSKPKVSRRRAAAPWTGGRGCRRLSCRPRGGGAVSGGQRGCGRRRRAGPHGPHRESSWSMGAWRVAAVRMAAGHPPASCWAGLSALREPLTTASKSRGWRRRGGGD